MACGMIQVRARVERRTPLFRGIPGSLYEGFPEIRHRCLCVALPVAIVCRLFYRCSHNVRETSKTNEGVWKETTETAPTLQFITRGHQEI